MKRNRTWTVNALAVMVGLSTSSAMADFRVETPDRPKGEAKSQALPAATKPESATGAVWTLQGGKRIDAELEQWARTAEWRFVWKAPVTWTVSATAEFGAAPAVKFADALTQVIELLYAEGKPVRVKIWEGNRVAEVYSSEVR